MPIKITTDLLYPDVFELQYPETDHSTAQTRWCYIIKLPDGRLRAMLTVEPYGGKKLTAHEMSVVEKLATMKPIKFGDHIDIEGYKPCRMVRPTSNAFAADIVGIK